MIPNYVNSAVAHLQIKMYEWERSFSGTKELRVYDETVFKNPHPVTSRITLIPIVAIDFILEDLRPLLIIVESLFFGALNAASSPFRLLIQGPKEAKRSIHYTFFSINQIGGALSTAVVKISTTIIFIFVQLGVTFHNPQGAFPSRVNLNPVWIARRHEVDCNDFLDPGTLSEDRRLIEPLIDLAQNGLFSLQKQLIQHYPLVGRLVMIPLAAPLAAADSSIEILRPLVMVVCWLAIAVLTLSFVAIDLVQFEFSDALEDLHVTFAFINAGIDSLTEAIQNTVMTPITLIAQTLNILWDPKNALPSRVGFYTYQHGDAIGTIWEMKKVIDFSKFE